jgi:GTP pyrophosphokinase
VERLLQREGKTAFNLDELAGRLGFKEAQALFEVVGKDEYSLRNIELLLRPETPGPSDHAGLALHRSKAGESGVLVVGVESLMTHLARCCRPAPPDAIGGFVTRGRGVAIHRLDCSNFRHMAEQSANRVIPVAWGQTSGREAVYPVDVLIEASDRQGLLRDISEVLAKERVNVTGVNTQSVKVAGSTVAKMTFTVEVTDAARLSSVLRQVAQVPGVHRAKRR